MNWHSGQEFTVFWVHESDQKWIKYQLNLVYLCKIYNFLFWIQENTLGLHIIIHVKNLGLINLMIQIKLSHHIFVPICHADQNSGTLWYYQKNKFAKEEF